MEFWQNIYSHFDPVAFNLGPVSVHWYGIMYALALLSAIFIAKLFIKYDRLPISDDLFDSYIWWAEIGVILGARLGYVLFYDTNTIYYLTHPWQIFNPYINGQFTGISGMSYHGAFFGNFFNQELVGRATDVPWGIYVGEVLRHPSQIYEAILEGLFVFAILVYFRKRKTFDGQLALMYGIFYSIARIIAEFYREPDSQLGFLYSNWLTMGILQSALVLIVCLVIYLSMNKKKVSNQKI